MKFVEIDEIEYRNLWENHPQKTFLSSPEIGKLRKNSGWNIYFVGIKDKNTLVAAAMLTSHIRKFGKYEFYSPRGLLVDYNNEQILDFFIINLKKYIKEKQGYVLRIDPYIINKERDINGDIITDGIDNTNIKNHLLSLGFKKVDIPNMEQVGWMFSLDLDGKDEKQILNEMKPNTRNTIRKASKIGIEIKELDYNDLEKFYNIMIETGARKNFSVRKIDYYQNMYKLFHDKGEIKYLITELNLKKYLKELKLLKKVSTEEINKLNDAKYNDGKKKAIKNEIESLKKRISDAETIINKTGKDSIILSGSMFIMIKPEIIYLSSGNYTEYLHFNSQYLIQWYMIKYGLQRGFKKYNFYGIPADINTHPKDYGIYEFKRGFNGYVEELIGEYELPISSQYYLLNLIHKIKK